MKKLLDKISKGGGLWKVLVLSSVLCSLKVGSFESIEYVQNFWSTLIGSVFKKKHMELFSFLSKLA